MNGNFEAIQKTWHEGDDRKGFELEKNLVI